MQARLLVCILSDCIDMFTPRSIGGLRTCCGAGVYAAMEDGLEAFASDVRSVCALFTAAAHRPKTPLAARLAERRAPEVAAAVTRLLDANFALRLGEARAGRRHSQAAVGEAAGAAEANGDAGADSKSPDVDLLSRSARRSLLALCVSASVRLAGGAPAVQAQLSHARHCANGPVRIPCWARALQCAGNVYDVTVWSCMAEACVRGGQAVCVALAGLRGVLGGGGHARAPAVRPLRCRDPHLLPQSPAARHPARRAPAMRSPSC